MRGRPKKENKKKEELRNSLKEALLEIEDSLDENRQTIKNIRNWFDNGGEL